MPIVGCRVERDEEARVSHLSEPGEAVHSVTHERPYPPRTLVIDDIEALAIGAWILGTGGGGDPYHKLLNMRQLYRQGHAITLIDPMSLADDALVAVLSNMGAPLVGQERLADPAFAVKPLRGMERYLGRRFDAVMSLEIGGGNGIHAPMIGLDRLRNQRVFNCCKCRTSAPMKRKPWILAANCLGLQNCQKLHAGPPICLKGLPIDPKRKICKLVQ